MIDREARAIPRITMNYSAVTSHAVNLTVHVYSHVPVSSLNGNKYENCRGRLFGDSKDQPDTDNT